jgi:outer membrane protein TolC
MELTQDRVELLAQIVDVAIRQRDLGELSELDLLRLERRREEARAAAREQDLLRRQAEARLNRWLALPLSAELDLVKPADLPSIAAAARDEAPADVPIDLGSLRRPELAMLAAQAQEQQAMLTVARLQWLEGIEAGPYLKHDGGLAFVGGEVAITVPLLDRGQAQRGMHDSQLAALEEQMLATQAALLWDVYEAVLRLGHARQRQATDLQAMYRRAVAEHDLLLQAQQLGEASAIDTRMSRLAVLDAELALELARLTEWHAQADLAAALGDRGETLHGHDAHGEH